MTEKVKTQEQEAPAEKTEAAKARDERAARPAVGRQFAGQQHYAVTLPEEEQAALELQKKYDHPNAIPLNAYFSHKLIRDPVMQASMRAYTPVKRATVEAWDEIFANH